MEVIKNFPSPKTSPHIYLMYLWRSLFFKTIVQYWGQNKCPLANGDKSNRTTKNSMCKNALLLGTFASWEERKGIQSSNSEIIPQSSSNSHQMSYIDSKSSPYKGVNCKLTSKRRHIVLIQSMLIKFLL